MFKEFKIKKKKLIQLQMNIGRSPQAQLLPIVKDLQGLGRICGQRYYGPLLDHIKGPF
jgi:hypothetical protein